ncbi:MAG: DUF4254 domain-containing protein [Leptothrix sp. (in: b-proteobacteria)]
MSDPILTARAVIDLHDTLLGRGDWPGTDTASALGLDPERTPLWHWVTTNHRNNSLLWAEEDLARRTRVSDTDIALNKRAIDRYNQARNDATERVDELLLTALGLVDANTAHTDAPLSTASSTARLNSETAGSMVDRMSIMALKIEAMRQQSLRSDASDEHRASSQVKLDRLRLQRGDLGACLDALLADCTAGVAYFKVYRQFKMYNDARFNPVLVAEQRAAQPGTPG